MAVTGMNGGFRQLPGLLLAWYDEHKRRLPWRDDPSAYHVWVSEIMLQQTRASAVIPYYERFLAALPDIKALAEAPEELLLKLWEGLGYYSRVRNMAKAARQVLEDYGGELPPEPERLCKLAGIGSYTAAAISSFAFGRKTPAVDGNLLRVFARLTDFAENIRTPAAKRLAAAFFDEIFPDSRPGDMNQALMDLGAKVCLPNGAPQCADCPLAELCLAKKAGRETLLPVMPAKKTRPSEERTVFVIRTADNVLLRRRPRKGLLAGLYEFPNEKGTFTKEDACSYCKNLGLSPVSVRVLPAAKHVFTHLEWKMTGFEICVAEDAAANFTAIADLKERIPLPSAFAVYTKAVMEGLKN
ncbi:MAG: A/G-specific adenine glycosylase [Eubacterium sp.]|nr:A/G-specific adenine glycosylase [Eubacterium sp.]